jgi:hypothetical protein
MLTPDIAWPLGTTTLRRLWQRDTC